MQSKNWIVWLAVVALSAGLYACGGSSSSGGGGAVVFRAATPADLDNKAFSFTGLADDPTASSTVTIGRFAGNTAAVVVADDTTGEVLGGTITIGSCTIEALFFADPTGDPILVGEPGFPEDVDQVINLDPCEIGSDGSLRITDTADSETLTGTPTTPGNEFTFDMLIPMSPAFEVQPAVPLDARPETGTARLTLFSAANILSHTTVVDNLTTGDNLVNSHIHGPNGGVAENDGVFVTLIANYAGQTEATGSAVLTAGQVTALNDLAANDFYVNIHSTDVGPGLLRGQLGQDIVLASNVPLAVSQVPANLDHATLLADRVETGAATLRLLGDNTLAFNLRVDNLATGDTVINAESPNAIAHIHTGASTQNAGVLITMVGGPDQVGQEGRQAGIDFAPDPSVGQRTFRAIGEFTLTASEAADLMNPTLPFYVQIHSAQVPPGLVRGQIRDIQLTSFANDVQPILTANCLTGAGGISCHVVPGTAPMSLQQGQAFGNLVNVQATGASSLNQPRVAPGSSSGSELVRRLTTTAVNLRMPLGAGPLSQVEVDLIVDWIDAGAGEN